MNQDKAMPSKRTERDVGGSKKSGAFEKRYISASEVASRWSVSVSAIYRGNLQLACIVGCSIREIGSFSSH